MSKHNASLLLILSVVLIGSCDAEKNATRQQSTKGPNFLIVVSDDQSWEHTSFAGYPLVSTPAFDEIANSGVYFTNAYASAPTCTASRTSLLSGKHFWQTGPGATLWGSFTKALPNFQQVLKQNGYRVGFTGKGWGPGKNQTKFQGLFGERFDQVHLQPPDGMSAIDYSANFDAFLSKQPKDKPFSFIFSPFEPHRPYGSIRDMDNRIDWRDVAVPGFLPDAPGVKKDITKYLAEIEWYDEHLQNILEQLQEHGVLDNTMIIVTSDNGMPFPRAKSSNYEYGVHVPLAVMWKGKISGDRKVTDFVNLADIAPTVLKAAGISIPKAMTGVSFLDLLDSKKSGRINPERNFTVTGFERHRAGARRDNSNYPIRALHTDDYLYIKNFFPDRWPAGDPPDFEDIDDESQSKFALLAAMNPKIKQLKTLATAKRPAEELYALADDPYQLNNLAGDESQQRTLSALRVKLLAFLTDEGDGRATGDGSEYDDLPYYAPAHQRINASSNPLHSDQ